MLKYCKGWQGPFSAATLFYAKNTVTLREGT